MKAYFHNKRYGNIIYDVFANPINETEWTHPFDPNWRVFVNAGFVPTFEKGESEPMVYYVAIKNRAEFWCGLIREGRESPSPKHILDWIDQDILKLARQKKLVIIIDNQAEGNSWTKNGFDAYEKTHYTMRNLELPQYSVMYVDSNKDFVNHYENWCIINRTPPKIAHSYALTGFYYFSRSGKIPIKPLILDAIENENAKDFNSLNRTARLHRLDHLYYLIKNNLHKNNLVSGNAVNREPGILLDAATPSPTLSVDFEEYVNTLNDNLPISVDGTWAVDNPDHNDSAIFNHDIYKNSLMSFVTETEVADQGMFITEKTFKPIVAGHPFILLAQPNTLEYIRELGYKVDFYGIDSSYDKIKNPRERFFKVHTELRRWIGLSRQEKVECIKKSMDIIEHNLELFKTKDYVLDSYINMRKTAEDIFAQRYRTFNVNHL